MAPMKRPAASAAGASAKRREKDPIIEKCSAIADTILLAEGFPQPVLSMLANDNCLLNSLAMPKEGRHAFQNEVVDMVGQVLAEVQRACEAKVQAAQGKVDGSEAEKGVREGAALAAAQAVAEKAAAKEAAKAALAAAAEVSTGAKGSLSEAVSAQKVGDKSYNDSAGKKERLQAALGGEYQALKDGTAAVFAKAMKAVVAIGKEFSFEAQLLASAEPALLKPPAERGDFDTLVLGQVEAAFQSVIAAFDAQLAEGEAGRVERAQRVEACQAEAAAAAERVQTCTAAATAAACAEKEAEAAKKAAEKSLKDHGPETRCAASDLDAAKEELASCLKDIASYQELKERPPLGAEPEADEADGAAAVAGEEAPAAAAAVA